MRQSYLNLVQKFAYTITIVDAENVRNSEYLQCSH